VRRADQQARFERLPCPGISRRAVPGFEPSAESFEPSLALWRRFRDDLATAVRREPGEEFAFARTEPFAGTVAWRYTFVAEGTGTPKITGHSSERGSR